MTGESDSIGWLLLLLWSMVWSLFRLGGGLCVILACSLSLGNYCCSVCRPVDNRTELVSMTGTVGFRHLVLLSVWSATNFKRFPCDSVSWRFDRVSAVKVYGVLCGCFCQNRGHIISFWYYWILSLILEQVIYVLSLSPQVFHILLKWFYLWDFLINEWIVWG